METDVLTFWILVLTSITGLLATIRFGRSGLGWLIVYGIVLVAAVLGKVSGKSELIYAAAAGWALLVLVPSVLSRIYYRNFLQQRYKTARRLARIISWLHPVDGWRQQPQIVGALEMAQAGDLARAGQALGRFQHNVSVIGLTAVANLYRITNQWEELMSWAVRNQAELKSHPQLLPVLLRAHGEVGDLAGMIQLYERNKSMIAHLIPHASRDLCRLVLFAFCGRHEPARRLLSGTLALLPEATKRFWRATADMAAGEIDSATKQFHELLPAADAALRSAIDRRLLRPLLPAQTLGEPEARVIEQTILEQKHDEAFGTTRSIFSLRARGTQVLIALNFAMFVAEIIAGGSTNLQTLYRLGAVFPPAIRAGGWWRLVAALFLHAGPAHLAMNMLALGVLGPFVEFALGLKRYLILYLVAGVGSMSIVMLAASGPDGQQMTVGASGCIMGLVGATGALMLRGWLRERALSARRRLMATLVIILMQTAFDFVIPQVSMTAHLSGALLGFTITLLLRDRPKATNLPATGGS
jgi:rhomboid protease GluP